MEIDSPRRLALQLHALHQDDRDWILSRLGHDVRAELEPLLADLDSLGFRIDQRMVDSLSDRGRAEEPHPVAHGEFDDDIALLDQAPPEWIITHLKGEPRALLDCLAAAHPWNWLESVSTSPSLDFSSSPGHESRLGPTERVRQALIGTLARKVRAEKPILNLPAPINNNPPATANASAFSGFRKWLPWKR